MENNTFKGTLFGGFKREDVIDYITKASAESNARISALEADVNNLLSQEKALRTELATAQAEKDALLTELEETREELSRAKSSYAGCESDRAKLFDEVTALRRETAVLRPQAEEYASVKAHIADIELLARQRAEALEADTRAKVTATLDTCRSHYNDALAVLSETCARISGELYQADKAVSALPSAMEALREELNALKIDE